MDALLERHDGFVHHTALYYWRMMPFCELEDLYAEGRIGLWLGIKAFDLSRDVGLLTFAAWKIKSRVQGALRRARGARLNEWVGDGGLESAPDHRADFGIARFEADDLLAASDRLLTAQEREVLDLRYQSGLTVAEIGKRLKICKERVRQILRAVERRLRMQHADLLN